MPACYNRGVGGIVGIVSARGDRQPDPRVIDAMAERLVRGEGDETEVVVRGPAALGIRRVRIDDLGAGQQPITGEDAATWVVCDGAIFNHRELTNRLAASGHVFRTRSDVEAIVHAWEDRGRDAMDDLDGVFGLAVWQEQPRTLVLARDRLGVKPLYYAVLPDQLVFASELRAMLAHPRISRDLNLDALAAYLVHAWVPAPQSMVGAVRKLPPGHRLVYAGGEAKVERWWDVRYGGGPRDEIVAVAHLAAAVDLAVRQQLRADVPVGVLLSGGIDSATLVAIARNHASRIETFTLGFEDAAYDESADARVVAAALDTSHQEHVVGERAALDGLDALHDLLDEPLGDVSLVPTALLARFARRSVAVVLSGTGTDEIFAGHAVYRAHRLARAWRRLPAPARLALAGVAGRATHRFVQTTGLDAIERHARWTAPCAPGDVGALLTADALARLSAPPSYGAYHQIAAGAADAGWLHQLLYLDVKGQLAEGALRALDRASRASSLQVRMPLLDRRLVEVAAALPPQMKLRGLRSKHILRRMMRGRVPAATLARPPKALDLPLARWFRGELGERLRAACESPLVGRDTVLRRDAVERLLDEHRRGRADHARALYTLLALLAWARGHGAA